MYIVTFTGHQQRNMVRTPPHFFGAGDATAILMLDLPSLFGKALENVRYTSLCCWMSSNRLKCTCFQHITRNRITVKRKVNE